METRLVEEKCRYFDNLFSTCCNQDSINWIAQDNSVIKIYVKNVLVWMKLHFLKRMTMNQAPYSLNQEVGQNIKKNMLVVNKDWKILVKYSTVFYFIWNSFPQKLGIASGQSTVNEINTQPRC